MPIHTGKDSEGPFYQWRHQKKYHYKAGNKKSMAAAKSKAEKQMKAIFSNGYIGEDINTDINIIQNIKENLLKIFHKNTWQEFINSQKYGNCKKNANYVAQLYPNIQIIEVKQNFS